MGRSKASRKDNKEEIGGGGVEAETPEADAVVEVEIEAETEEAAAVKPVVPVKRTPGVKIVIPFKWKLVGAANGLMLTLFKSVEREDVDAQLARIAAEGYYKDFRILDVDAPISQTSTVEARVPVHQIPTESPKKPIKSRRALTAAKKTNRPTSIRVRSAPSAKVSKSKASPRGAKKKAPAPVKKPKKRTAKKK